MRLLISTAALLVLLLFFGCSTDADDAAPTPVVAPTRTAIATPTVLATGEAPAPVHHTFAPGATIDVQDAGIFFVDIETGAAEGWVTPGSADNPFAFRVSGMSADGSRLIYDCARPAVGRVQPCGGRAEDPFAYYLFDTATGERTRLDAFTGEFVTLSPDGEMILGMTSRGLARAGVTQPDDVEIIDLLAEDSTLPHRAVWAPDGEAVAVSLGVNGYPSTAVWILRFNGAAPVELVHGGAYPATWSSDGTKIGLLDQIKSGMWVYDDRGLLLWTRADPISNAQWSPDGRLLAISINPGQESEEPERIEMVDSATGEAQYRIVAALGCGSRIWNAGGSLLLFGSYANEGRMVVADPAERTYAATDSYWLMPSPDDPELAIVFDGEAFESFDLMEQQRTGVIARTASHPAWFFDHPPFFAGGRIVFTSPHLGHGGCGEAGSGITTKPEPRFEFPPFE